MNSESGKPARTRQRWIVPVLALMFFGPLLAAWIFYFGGSGWRPGGQVNHGRLLDPVSTITVPGQAGDAEDTSYGFRDTWSLAVVGRGQCAEQCLDLLDKTRRVRLALRQKAPRVSRVLLYRPAEPVSSALARQTSGVTLIPTNAEPGLSLLEEFSGADSSAMQEWSVFIVDPLGNVVMVFEPQFEMRGMLADLKRLLRLSRIG